ncbi:MAG: HAMP domain-containing protein [Desulfobacteraceae bacterium]|jgi:sigma-B regulation protein RsbU (phosphoserine phosphatase)|nr:MAG: HAMP domain-containing protein [Desulfobacteraceae bacterium]
MYRKTGLALRISLLVLSSITAIFSVVFLYNYIFSRQIIQTNIERNAESLTLSTIHKIDGVLGAVERAPRNLAIFLEELSYGDGELIELIKAVVQSNPDIYGATIAFEPFKYSPNARTFAPYYCKKKGGIEFTYIPYDYFGWDWYQLPKELEAPVWTEPYFDEGAGGIIMATFSVPFYRKIGSERVLTGIVTADISLSWLQEIISSVKISDTGYGFLISRNGTFITHPDPQLVMNETIFSVAETKEDQSMRELGRKMINGSSGYASFTSLLTGKKCWMRYTPLPTSGWSLAVLFPQDELMADITRLNRTVISIGLAGFFIILLVIVLIARSITRPLKGLSVAAGHIAKGDLDAEIPEVKNRDEVADLADSFRFMKASLKKYIADLKETTAAKERIESELKIAHDIQMSILPKTFPPFPDRYEFELYAMIEPAREVGGDLYDFFFLDETNLCFAIGDVSGKGVPASLFMAVTRTLIKTKATQGLEPGKLLTRVNQDLCVDNDAMMFVTLFLGILDVRTGELQYSNAGHNPPYILGHSGETRAVKEKGGAALGVMEDCEYRSHNVIMRPGETLFLYTDGVTEAADAAQNLFSDQRLVTELSLNGNKPVRDIVSSLMARVKAFSHEVEQTDDITMLVIRYRG